MKRILLFGIVVGLVCLNIACVESGWQRDGENLLTNFINMYNPCVVETDDTFRYKMWFFGWAANTCNDGYAGCDAIFHARSNDLKEWQVYSGDNTWDDTMDPNLWVPVIAGGKQWYHEWHNGDPSVVLRDGKYYMAYSATTNHIGKVPGYPAEMVQCVMGAISDDGIHWTKTSEPLLIREGDCANPQPEPDRIGDFHRPSLMWDRGKWRLWFDYWLPGEGVCMGLAENTGDFMQPGGFEITHDLKEPIFTQWVNPEIIKVDEKYFGFSDAKGYPKIVYDEDDIASVWQSRQLCEAISDDGVHWKRIGFIDPDPDTQACHVPQALLTTIDGQRWLYLFYSTQIGNKKNDGKYHYQYDNIRAMRRKVD